MVPITFGPKPQTGSSAHLIRAFLLRNEAENSPCYIVSLQLEIHNIFPPIKAKVLKFKVISLRLHEIKHGYEGKIFLGVPLFSKRCPIPSSVS